MALRSFLVLIVLIALGQQAFAQNLQNTSALREVVKTYLSKGLIEQYGEQEFKDNVEIHVSRLDSRLKLADCAGHIKTETTHPPQGSQNLAVKVRCEKNNLWTLYIPVTIKVYTEVMVAMVNIPRGTVIEESDLTTMRLNTAGLGINYVSQAKKVVGKQAKRPIKQGTPIKFSSLEELDIVQRGEPVVIEAKLSRLAVTAPGEALSSGHLGQKIRVRNTKSGRIIDAIVRGPGVVSVIKPHHIAARVSVR